MKTIEVETTIPENGILTLHLPPGAEPGDEVHVRLTPPPVATKERPPLDLPLHHIGPWPEDLPLRREDMYGDDGR